MKASIAEGEGSYQNSLLSFSYHISLGENIQRTSSQIQLIVVELCYRCAPNRIKTVARPIAVLWRNKSVIRSNHRHRAVAPVV